MTWIQDTKDKRSWLQRLAANVLKCGAVPRHVAFIMDGNRRFAKKNSMDRADGHLKGFDKLAETLEWCLDMGVTEVTVYAFSIENFKRSKEEVDCLMEIARKKFARLLQEKDLIEKHEVCVRVLGDIDLLPLDVQQLIAEAVAFSRNNKRATLNVCFAYTSRDEICTAMREIAEGVENNIIHESDINERVMSRCMYTSPSAEPDMLVRTSGEVRLSDFLLWQSSYSLLSFVRVLWPEFSIWNFYAGILHYQTQHSKLQAEREAAEEELDQSEAESDYQCVLEQLSEQQPKVNSHAPKPVSRTQVEDRLEHYKTCRQQRLETFYKYVYDKRNAKIDCLLERMNKHTPLCS